jgi:hypothetical protein
MPQQSKNREIGILGRNKKIENILAVTEKTAQQKQSRTVKTDAPACQKERQCVSGSISLFGSANYLKTDNFGLAHKTLLQMKRAVSR